MLVLGIILAVVGYLLGVGVIETVGVILVVVGAVFLLLGETGHYTGRRWY
jgi:hypothetical protein